MKAIPWRTGRRDPKMFRNQSMVSILLGLVLIVGGLSGKVVLHGSRSVEVLAVIGTILVLWGILRVMVIKPND